MQKFEQELLKTDFSFCISIPFSVQSNKIRVDSKVSGRQTKMHNSSLTQFLVACTEIKLQNLTIKRFKFHFWVKVLVRGWFFSFCRAKVSKNGVYHQYILLVVHKWYINFPNKIKPLLYEVKISFCAATPLAKWLQIKRKNSFKICITWPYFTRRCKVESSP